MNILGTCRHLLGYLSLNSAEGREPQAKKDVDSPAPNRAPEDRVEIEDPADSDGPGAGGGYDTLGDNDGPGAGGGYDTLGDNDNDGPASGEHPGGGYDTDELPTESSAQYLGEEWFLGTGKEVRAANSNKAPRRKN